MWGFILLMQDIQHQLSHVWNPIIKWPDYLHVTCFRWIPNDKSAVNLPFTALPWHHFFGSQKSKHDTLLTQKPWWSTLPRKEKKATLAKPNWRTHSIVPNDSTCYNYCDFYGHIILSNNLHTLKLWRIDTQKWWCGKGNILSNKAILGILLFNFYWRKPNFWSIFTLVPRVFSATVKGEVSIPIAWM